MKRLIYILLLVIIPILCLAETRMVAEWEPMIGSIIRWPLGIPHSLAIELAEDDSLFVIVQNTAQENSARGLFNNIGLNLNNVRFIYAETNSHWTRDWGPHSAFVNGEYTIIDPIFDGYPWVPGRIRDYDEDDLVNVYLASQINANLVSFPAYLTGGNFMTDGYRSAFSTQLMLDENLPLYSNDEFFLLSSNVLGISNYQISLNPELYGIQHIDCWAKLLNEQIVLVKKLDANHPEYARAESLAVFFANQNNVFGNPYRVKRILCSDYDTDEAAAYTNSLILNHKVLVPLFGIPADSLALQTYRTLMPGYDVQGFYYSSWYYYDALHCRVMGIANRNMLRIEHNPQNSYHSIDNSITLNACIKAYSGASINSENVKLHYRKQSEDEWFEIIMQTNGENLFSADINDISNEEVIDYYFEAEDMQNNHAFLPVNAPHSSFNSIVYTFVSNHDIYKPQNVLSIYPNPSKDLLHISFISEKHAKYNMSIYNVKGQIVLKTDVPSEKFSINLNELNIKSGVYFLKVNGKGNEKVKKFLYIK